MQKKVNAFHNWAEQVHQIKRYRLVPNPTMASGWERVQVADGEPYEFAIETPGPTGPGQHGKDLNWPSGIPGGDAWVWYVRQRVAENRTQLPTEKLDAMYCGVVMHRWP